MSARRPRQRFALRLVYDGSAFRGFQRQPGVRTVESALLLSLEACGLGAGLAFASRTDAGVHALGQVVAVRAPGHWSAGYLQQVLAQALPPDIGIAAAAPAPRCFHPRWSAVLKRYEYRLAPPQAGPAEARTWSVEDARGRADFEPALGRALEALRRAPRLDGFTAAGAPPKPAPPLTRLEVARDGAALVVALEGPAFRRYAVRHMIGCAVAEATGLLPEGACAQRALEAPPYRGLRAPAHALVLARIDYAPGHDPFAPHA